MIEYHKNYNLENLPYINDNGLICWEEFRDIPDYEGLYQVSDLGRIKSLRFNRGSKEKIRKLPLNNDGYPTVRLSKDGSSKTKSVHQLVAIVFLNHIPCGLKLVVNHKNFIRNDNRVSNLEIVTNRENCNRKHLESFSKYTGVAWDKNYNRWTSVITFEGNRKHLGRFTCEIEASKYYENALLAIQNGTEIQTKKYVTSSKYKGVSWNKYSKSWTAKIRIGGIKRHLGYFKKELEAHEAVENALKLQTE